MDLRSVDSGLPSVQRHGGTPGRGKVRRGVGEIRGGGAAPALMWTHPLDGEGGVSRGSAPSGGEHDRLALMNHGSRGAPLSEA